MKLAIVRQKYTPFGGAERFVASALDALRAQGVAVEVIAREWRGDTAGVLCDPFYLGRTWRDWSFARCVQKIISAGKYDLVQSHERIPGCHIYRAGDGVHATWLELSGKPWRLAPWHRYTLAAEAALLRHPDLRAVICNSRMVKDDIAQRFPEAADKLHVIYNGVDTRHFHPGLRKEHRTAVRAKVGAGKTAAVILFVGSGYERKGVATLIEALAQMDTRSAEAWIVGRDKHEARYQRLAMRCGVADRVRFLGAQSDVRPFYGAADLFCLPTIYDPLPNAALEALACGLPVVTTENCGAAELLTSGINGALVPASSPGNVWAPVLEHMLARAAEPNTPTSAREAVAANDFAAMTERLIALYASLGITKALV
ncbi:glycosyltransferase family 4 protein [Sulfuricystis multivorans]|uniref:glycosyltransferase family 4 protein n=1 Tax=Sulfuricystis multivorans TaxID=2211108 RepID=UPI000F837C69|nr:glycosyltransferase family 4 protein [Sulfuricystis multivorans]